VTAVAGRPDSPPEDHDPTEDGGAPPSADIQAVVDRLADVAEQLAELALARLQRLVEADEPTSAGAARWRAEERQLTRARRAVERAVGALGGPLPGGAED
jgi:hypothetical protein